MVDNRRVLRAVRPPTPPRLRRSTRTRWAVAALAACAATGALAGGAGAQAPAATVAAAPEPEREIIVRFAPGTRAAGARARTLRGARARASRTLPASRLTVARVDPGTSPAAAAAAAERLPGVAWAEPNGTMRTHLIPGDPLFGEQWGHHNTAQPIGNAAAGTADADIDAPEAWNADTGAPSVLVAVIDTGVDLTNPDLDDRLWTNPGESGGEREANGVDDDGNGLVDDVRGWDFVDGDNNPQDFGSSTGGPPIDHGTVAASIVGAEAGNGFGGAGVSHGARIVGIRALGRDGGGSFADIAEAMNLAAGYGAQVVNLSLGGPTQSQAIADAIATNPDTLFVASAGNSGSNNDVTPAFPCNDPSPNVVCVAATDRDDQIAGFSNFGPSSVDIAAPGVAVLGAQNARQTVYAEDFESGLGDWLTQGTWGLTAGRSTSGSMSLADSPAGPYANGTTTLAFQTSALTDLAGLRGCRAHAFADRDLAPGDDLIIAASNGGSSFTPLETYGGSTGDRFLELSGDLGAFEGGPVRLAVALAADGAGAADGVYVDDVAITCLGGAYTAQAASAGAAGQAFGPQYTYADGTSFSAPYVTGALAVLLGGGVPPDAAVAALLAGADRVPGLAGLVGTGRLNLAEAMRNTPDPVTPPAVTVVGTPVPAAVPRLPAEADDGPPRLRTGSPVFRGDRGALTVTLSEAARLRGWVRGRTIVQEAVRVRTRTAPAAGRARELATRIVNRTRIRRATKRIVDVHLPAGRSTIPLGRVPSGGTLRVRLTPIDERGTRGRTVNARVTRARRTPRPARPTTARRAFESVPDTPATPGPESPVPGLVFPKPIPAAASTTVAGPPGAFDLCSVFSECTALGDPLRRPLTPGGPSRAELAHAAGQPVPAPAGVFVGLPQGTPAGTVTRSPRRTAGSVARAKLSRLERRFRDGDPHVVFRMSRAATVTFEATRAAPPARAARLLRQAPWTIRARRGLNVVRVPARWRCVREGARGAAKARGAAYLVLEAQHRANVRVAGNRYVGVPNPRCLA